MATKNEVATQKKFEEALTETLDSISEECEKLAEQLKEFESEE